MNLTAEEQQAGWFELKIIQSELSGHGLEPGDIAVFKPVDKVEVGRIYAILFDGPMPELDLFSIHLARKKYNDQVYLWSKISAFSLDVIGDTARLGGELVRVYGGGSKSSGPYTI